MATYELLESLLRVGPAWEVHRCQQAADRLDVWIGPRRVVERGWFKRTSRTPDAPAREFVWRHTNLCGVQCHVHALTPDAKALQGLPWTGGNSPFTHAMGKQIFMLLAEGIEYGTICGLLDIALSDLWKYKYALDSGRIGVSGLPASAARDLPRPSKAGPAAEPPAGAALVRWAVPDATDTVWQRLVEGSLTIDVKVLGLKLLLTKLRTQWPLIDVADVKVAKLRELHRYFLKSERILGHELAQLGAARALRPGPAALRPSAPIAAQGLRSDLGPVPEPTDSVWQRLIEGSLAIDVKTLGLRLLLTKLRTQWRSIVDEDVKVAKLRELHRYFMRSERILGYELGQIRGEVK
jgi:hypothetical protein